MWRSRRRQQDAVANAIVHLVQDGMLQIRTMAYLREGMLDRHFPEADYQEQIRLVADALDLVIPGLRQGFDYSPTEALQAAWDNRDDQQRRWIRDTLAAHGLDVHDFIAAADHGNPPGAG
jgi:hypothetical protein